MERRDRGCAHDWYVFEKLGFYFDSGWPTIGVQKVCLKCEKYVDTLTPLVEKESAERRKQIDEEQARERKAEKLREKALRRSNESRDGTADSR